QQVLYLPFRADSYKSSSIPRALPWAFLSGPFRAGSTHRRATNRAGSGIAKSMQPAQLFISPGRGRGRTRARRRGDVAHCVARGVSSGSRRFAIGVRPLSLLFHPVPHKLTKLPWRECRNRTEDAL